MRSTPKPAVGVQEAPEHYAPRLATFVASARSTSSMQSALARGLRAGGSSTIPVITGPTGRRGHLRRDDDQNGEYERSHERGHGHRQRPPRLRSLPAQEAPDVCMLEIADHDERGATEDDEDSYGAVEVFVL